MHDATARNLRTAERFLLAPPLAASFGAAPVSVCDISQRGARFKHDRPLEAGAKAILKMAADAHVQPVAVEAVVMWTQSDSTAPGRYVSGVRTYSESAMDGLLAHLHTSNRSRRVEELRKSDRFFIAPLLDATFAGARAVIENLSARGAGIETRQPLSQRFAAPLVFRVNATEVAVSGEVRWCAVKAIGGTKSYRAGLLIAEKPELMRLAIGQLGEMNRATIDTSSLRLKLKIIQARARQFAGEYRDIEASGIPAEQYLLIHSVREELRLNPEEAMHWYRRARMIINDPAVRALAPPIADHPDALAVWEYLDRTVDPTVVGRAFEIRR